MREQDRRVEPRVGEFIADGIGNLPLGRAGKPRSLGKYSIGRIRRIGIERLAQLRVEIGDIAGNVEAAGRTERRARLQAVYPRIPRIIDEIDTRGLTPELDIGPVDIEAGQVEQ